MRRAGLHERNVAYAPEAQAIAANQKGGSTQAEKRSGLSLARGLLSSLGLGSATSDTALGAADASARKSGEELTEEELRPARRSPAASSAPRRCGRTTPRSAASTASAAGWPRTPRARNCRGPSA